MLAGKVEEQREGAAKSTDGVNKVKQNKTNKTKENKNKENKLIKY
jgi:hypothetical protein